MKKRLVVILLTIVMSITLGYLFFLSLLLGVLATKYMAAESVGERGKIRSIVIPFIRWRIHLHHWLYSLWLIGLSSATGIHFLTPTITYGLLGGVTFQGIYSYSDWHMILIKRHRTRAKDRLSAARKDGAHPESGPIATFGEAGALEK
jgi:hypothetical protein